MPVAQDFSATFAPEFRASMALTVSERLHQDALADGPEHEAEQPSLEVLALADHDDVHVGRPVGLPREV